MLIWREKLASVPVMSLQTGARLATASEPIIDPKDFSIVAFYCEGPLVDHQPAVLHTGDIREFGSLGLIINDSDDIMPLNDLVRLQKIIDYKFELIGKKVIDTTKRRMGKVNNYVIDSGSYKIIKFSVKRPLMHSLNQSELMVDRRQIRKVTDSEIVVAAPTAEDDAATALERNQIQNPFRGRTPEHPRAAEHSETN